MKIYDFDVGNVAHANTAEQATDFVELLLKLLEPLTSVRINVYCNGCGAPHILHPTPNDKQKDPEAKVKLLNLRWDDERWVDEYTW